MFSVKLRCILHFLLIFGVSNLSYGHPDCNHRMVVDRFFYLCNSYNAPQSVKRETSNSNGFLDSSVSHPQVFGDLDEQTPQNRRRPQVLPYPYLQDSFELPNFNVLRPSSNEEGTVEKAHESEYNTQEEIYNTVWQTDNTEGQNHNMQSGQGWNYNTEGMDYYNAQTGNGQGRKMLINLPQTYSIQAESPNSQSQISDPQWQKYNEQTRSSNAQLQTNDPQWQNYRFQGQSPNAQQQINDLQWPNYNVNVQGQSHHAKPQIDNPRLKNDNGLGESSNPLLSNYNLKGGKQQNYGPQEVTTLSSTHAPILDQKQFHTTWQVSDNITHSVPNESASTVNSESESRENLSHSNRDRQHSASDSVEHEDFESFNEPFLNPVYEDEDIQPTIDRWRRNLNSHAKDEIKRFVRNKCCATGCPFPDDYWEVERRVNLCGALKR